MRGLFDIVLKKNNPILAGRFLQISQMLEHQQWFFETPLRQFTSIPEDILTKIDQRDISIEQFKEMDSKEIGNYFCLRKKLEFLYLTLCSDGETNF